jgi:hypothetical protein
MTLLVLHALFCAAIQLCSASSTLFDQPTTEKFPPVRNAGAFLNTLDI